MHYPFIKARLGALGACLLLVLSPAGTSAPADVIQPGVQVNGNCTLNFVFDGLGVNEGLVLVGSAAHCVDHVGQVVSTNAHPQFGHVAFIASPGEGATDFAFIEVYPDFIEFVRVDVKGHAGQPTGTTVSTDTNRGAILRFSGYRMGFDASAATQEGRFGLLESDTDEAWRAYAPIMFGDSGGPVLHASGKALGIVTDISIGHGVAEPFVIVGGSGPTIEGVLAHAVTEGFPVAVRTVQG